MKNILFVLTLSIILLQLTSCTKQRSTPQHFSQTDSIRIINEIVAHRSEVDSAFRFDPSSPFKRDSGNNFDGIKWFPPDVRYYFKSKLFRYEKPEVMSIYGTKGEERKHLKYGYFAILFDGKEYRLNVYKFTASDPQRYQRYKNYLSVWFTDETTGKETYNVGRYVEVGDENTDPDFLYVINFNNAYNPYCAYSATYSCAIPPKDDHLDIPIRAGEMKYHH